MRESNCLLEEDINTCSRYDREKGFCKDDFRACGMYNKASIVPSKNVYVRKPRWYEKYYKNKQTILKYN